MVMHIKNKDEARKTNLSSVVHLFAAASFCPDNSQEGSLRKLRSAGMTVSCLFTDMFYSTLEYFFCV